LNIFNCAESAVDAGVIDEDDEVYEIRDGTDGLFYESLFIMYGDDDGDFALAIHRSKPRPIPIVFALRLEIQISAQSLFHGAGAFRLAIEEIMLTHRIFGLVEEFERVADQVVDQPPIAFDYGPCEEVGFRNIARRFDKDGSVGRKPRNGLNEIDAVIFSRRKQPRSPQESRSQIDQAYGRSGVLRLHSRIPQDKRHMRLIAIEPPVMVLLSVFEKLFTVIGAYDHYGLVEQARGFEI